MNGYARLNMRSARVWLEPLSGAPERPPSGHQAGTEARGTSPGPAQPEFLAVACQPRYFFLPEVDSWAYCIEYRHKYLVAMLP